VTISRDTQMDTSGSEELNDNKSAVDENLVDNNDNQAENDNDNLDN
jgi:hypothetical protein